MGDRQPAGLGWHGDDGRSNIASLASVVVVLILLSSLLRWYQGTTDDAIQVAVVWTSEELALFRTVVDEYEAEKGTQVTVISTGDDIDGFLQARARAGNLPDVAILPQPGLIEDYAEQGWIVPLGDELEDRYIPFWRDLGSVPAAGCQGEDEDECVRELYGAWVKASFKSMFWYRTDLKLDDIPQDWAALAHLMVEQADDQRTPAPLALGAADSWVLTDWLENLLLAQRGGLDVYDALLAGEPCWDAEPVVTALHLLGELLTTEDLLAGSTSRALQTQFDESVVQLATEDAGMLQGSDFAEAVTVGVLEPMGVAPELRAFRFPSVDGPEPFMVGGDVAVVMDDSEGGHDLVEWLARPESFQPWVSAGGFISPVLGEEDEDLEARYPHALAYLLAVWMAEPPPDLARFDLSDQLSSAARAALGSILQDYLGDVTENVPNREEDRQAHIEGAVDDVVARLTGTMDDLPPDPDGGPAGTCPA